MNLYQEASTDANILGYEYYLENKISKIKQINEFKFEGYAINNKDYPYHVTIDTLVPKRSSCECRYALKNKICKHMIALSYSIFEEDALMYGEWVYDYDKEYGDREGPEDIVDLYLDD